MSTQFVKATKKQAKLRLAIDGPTGSGKTYTALVAATVMANGGKIAVIDTERNSAALYSDEFEFDVAALDNFNPRNYINLIDSAEEAGYAVIIIDSLSHAWEGEGGALDMVDAAAKRSQAGNSWAAWKDVTPLHRKLIDAMLQSKCHVIVTMRSKMEYALEKDEKTGRNTVRKLGLAPVQRQGMEYEFTIVGDMDVEHNLVVTKSRCKFIADAVVNKPDKKFFKKILDWLNSGEAVTEPEPEKKAETKNEFKDSKATETESSGNGSEKSQPHAKSQSVKISELGQKLWPGQWDEKKKIMENSILQAGRPYEPESVLKFVETRAKEIQDLKAFTTHVDKAWPELDFGQLVPLIVQSCQGDKFDRFLVLSGMAQAAEAKALEPGLQNADLLEIILKYVPEAGIPEEFQS